jgi:cytochrome b
MKTLIWTLPTRIFHWLLAIGFTATYLLGEEDKLRPYHMAFGILVGLLILFRVVFGFIGPKYAHFRDFRIGINRQVEFIKKYFSIKSYNGHNPIAAVIMLAILIVGLLCSASGYLLYAHDNNVLTIFTDAHFLEGTHEFLANFFLALVLIHLTGLALDFIFHRSTGTLFSMFSGYKNVDGEPVKLSGFQKVFSLLWIIVPFIFFYFSLGLKETKSKDEQKNKIEKSERKRRH